MLVVPVLVLGLALAGCGGKDKPKPGTPAATGVAPDCSIAPLDLVNKTLERELTGPVAEPTPGGSICTYARAKGAGANVDQVKLIGNVDKASFDLVRQGFKKFDAPVKKIGGWGDEAFAASVFGFSDTNTFAVRKGRVSVTLVSTADYDHLKKLMKALLEKV
jgi:hypothetical protein